MWSWRPKLASSLAGRFIRPGECHNNPLGDGGNGVRLPEESTKETVKTIRAGKAGMSWLHLWSTRARSFRTRDCGCQPAPGLPCAFCSFRRRDDSKTRAEGCREDVELCLVAWHRLRNGERIRTDAAGCWVFS